MDLMKKRPSVGDGKVAVKAPLEKTPSRYTLHTSVSIDSHGYPRHKDHKLPKPISERESAVLVRNLCKGYEKHGPRVLNNFSMNVKKGTIYGLLGSSGCGKTTALSCIVGLKKWESGEILVFGEKPGTKESGIPGKRLGYVPQDIALYDHLSIKENIQYYGRLYGMSEYDILEQWSLLVNLLQLPNEFKLVTNLSGGQKRRCSLALALVHHPELLILDEPTVGLDPLLRESVWQHMYNLVQTRGTSIIITTHYIEESRYSDTIGVMRHGRLLVEDSPGALMAEHKTDLLEDVVLKLCWEDTRKAMRNAPRASIFVPKNPFHDDGDSDDGDSGTGTDNDVNDTDGGRNSASDNGEAAEPSVPGSSTVALTASASSMNNNDTNATTKVPNKPEKKPRRPLLRSTSSEVCGVLFHSKWKPELDGVVTDGNCSLKGSYNYNIEFDTFKPSETAGEAIAKNGRRDSTGGPKQLLASALTFTQRVAAFCCVIYLSMIRHPVFCLATLVLPAGEVLLTISSVGKEPKGLKMAVINDEMPNWMTQCSEFNLPPIDLNNSLIALGSLNNETLECNFNELSCKYLGLMSKKSIMDMIPYETVIDAENDIHQGKLWGYIHFGNNYSQHMIDRLATKHFAFEETILGSAISIRMDMSQYLGSVIIIKSLFEGLQAYVQQLIDSCELGARQAEIPLVYRTPVYGSLDDSYHNFIIPGVLANIMFMMPFAISGLIFITDLKQGTLGRARVAGLTTTELMAAYTITQGTMVIGQIIICTMCLKLGFDFKIVGSTLLYIGITFLLGMCGQAFGIFMGILCQDEIEALIAALFILPTMLMFGGVLWPLDCMAPLWKYIGASLPTTLIIESLRSTATRGVGITHGLMWPGLAVTTGWLILFWVLAVVAYRICIK